MSREPGPPLWLRLLIRLSSRPGSVDFSEDQGGGSSSDVEIVEWGPNAPIRIRIVPDRYHVPYAGTAGDGRRFFLSQELFESDRQFVGVFLWTADGEFDELRVDEVARARNVPPGMAGKSRAKDVVNARLAELEPITRERISVSPFEAHWDGVRFGFVEREVDGTPTVCVEPGDFIAYYSPWDGREYDT